jgi:hypothetical protein
MKGSETKHGTTDENNKKKTNQFFKKEQRERDTICWWRSRRRQNVSDSFLSFLFFLTIHSRIYLLCWKKKTGEYKGSQIRRVYMISYVLI